jgi:hypothetical protein
LGRRQQTTGETRWTSESLSSAPRNQRRANSRGAPVRRHRSALGTRGARRDSRPSLRDAAARSDNRTYVLLSWFVRPVPIIGPSTVPLTVEAVVPHSGKLNTLSQRAGDVGGKGGRCLLRSRRPRTRRVHAPAAGPGRPCRQERGSSRPTRPASPQVAAIGPARNSCRRVCWAQGRTVRTGLGSSADWERAWYGGACAGPGRVMSARSGQPCRRAAPAGVAGAEWF